MTKRAVLGGVEVGEGVPVAVIGALNVSPESFYAGSVIRDRDQLLTAAQRMVEAGAVIVDVGGMSTAPYLKTRISEAEETHRLSRAVEWLAAKLAVPVSADTCRAGPARAALEAGAQIINDVSGLTADPEMGPLVARTGAGLILMAHARRPPAAGAEPADVVRDLLKESLAIAGQAGIPEERVVVDPGIGFFRTSDRPWHEWDCRVLARLGVLSALGRPVCVGVSRKSFIGRVAGPADPGERLPGSLAATAVAVLNGARLIRCHDVAETCQAVRVAEAIRGQG